MAETVFIREEKNPGIAALCSILPGLGQIYNGEVGKAVAFLIATIIGGFFLIIPGIIIWVVGIYDAYNVAKKMNSGAIPYRSSNSAVMIIFAIAAFIILSAALFMALLISAAFMAGFTSAYESPSKSLVKSTPLSITALPTITTSTMLSTQNTPIPITSSENPSLNQLKCNVIDAKWIETEYQGRPISGASIRIYSNNQIELFVNNQLTYTGTWTVIGPNHLEVKWYENGKYRGTDTVSISPDCNTQTYVSNIGEHSTWIRV